MVMDQCEDRCHRLGQTKDVDITYHDVSMTIDDVLRQINITKATNAKILLADGSSLGTATGLSYADASGQLGCAISSARSERIRHVMSSQKHINDPLPVSGTNLLESSKDGPRLNASSLVDAIASSLGFALPDHAPRPARKVSPVEVKDGSIPHTGIVSDTCSDPSSVHSDSSDTRSQAAVLASKKPKSFLDDDSSDDDSIPDAFVFRTKMTG